MIINAIQLTDFGPYSGDQTLHLTGNTDKPKQENIFLVGGMNGSGKSSIFKAVQICLYGQAALGSFVSRRAYEDQLRNLIHKGPGLFENFQASVGVHFTVSPGGERAEYFVKRTWRARNTALSEFLEVRKNGLPIDGHEQQYWQDFLQHLIPQGLLNLFFFDGERITALTQSDESTQLAESIQALFGLNVIRQLRADLRYIERKGADNKGRSREILDKIDENDKQLAQSNAQFAACIERRAGLVTQHEVLSRRLLEWRRRLNQKGGTTGADPEELQRQVTAFDKHIEDKNMDLKRLFQGALPFCFAKEYLGYSLARLAADSSGKFQSTYSEQFDSFWNAAQSELTELVPRPTTLSTIRKLLSPSIENKSDHKFPELGATVMGEVQRWFEHDAQDSLIDAAGLVEQIEALTRQRDELLALLEVLPENSDIAQEIDQVNRIAHELGATENQLATAQQEEAALAHSITSLTKNSETLLTLLDHESLGDRKTELTAKAILTLSTFERRLVEAKIGALEKNFVSCFNNLMRKGDIISSIQIDPSTLAIRLIGTQGRELLRSQLSEGEKQIFAIALLHAITRTSKCPYPIIIDTPLGRLDSVHRSNIVNNYLPYASHQVIVLSTDTEIDHSFHADLKPYINKSFVLHYEHEQRRTEIREGYFTFKARAYESIAN